MAFELMDMLLNFLCPTSNAASQCQTFISSHSSVAPPFGQYIYFLFFPTVFLLLFLWIVFKDVVRANKGISLIASIAVYVFIIIQGLYPVFLWLGEAWIVVIFILGFLYMLTRRFRKEGGGGKGGGMAATGGGSLLRTVGGMVGGDISKREKVINDRLNDLETAANELKSTQKGTDAASRALNNFNANERLAEAAIDELDQFSVRFPVPGSKGRKIVDFENKHRNRFNHIVESVKNRR